MYEWTGAVSVVFSILLYCAITCPFPHLISLYSLRQSSFTICGTSGRPFALSPSLPLQLSLTGAVSSTHRVLTLIPRHRIYFNPIISRIPATLGADTLLVNKSAIISLVVTYSGFTMPLELVIRTNFIFTSTCFCALDVASFSICFIVLGCPPSPSLVTTHSRSSLPAGSSLPTAL